MAIITLSCESFLLHLETMTVLHRVQASLPTKIRKNTFKSQQQWLTQTLGAISLYEISSDIAEEIARNTLYGSLRTLDAIHLATAKTFSLARINLEIASFDKKMCEGAKMLGLPVSSM